MPLPEREPVIERPTTPEIPPEIEHIEAVAGAEHAMPQPVADDSGAVVMDNATPQQVTVTLPLTDEEMNRALHLKIIYSLRWLAELTRRLLKKTAGQFIYKYGITNTNSH